MNIEELKKQFIVDEDALKARLQPIISKALVHCRIDREGQVLLINRNLSSKDQVKLVLAARAIASQLEPSIKADVTTVEIGKYTGLPQNQIRARGKDATKEKFAQSPKRGVYRAIAHRVEDFLDDIAAKGAAKTKAP